MQIIRQRAFARAGLVGNPSDGYYGKTISVIVCNYWAEVILYEWERIELLPSQEDHSRFDSIDELAQDVQQHGYYGGIRLVKATVRKFVEFCARQRRQGTAGYDLHDRKFSIRYESNIPRQVGMAGSSAIIVATLRALMEFYGVSIPRHVLPSLALRVETDELGIAAGLQDRVIQVYGGVVYMDFAQERTFTDCDYECGRYESLDTRLLPPLYMAFATDHSEPTEVLHNPLRTLFAQDDPQVVAAMKDFADYASLGREAIRAGDTEQLSDLIDRNFNTRQRICQLPESHAQMVQMARRTGASAKFAGSGGAIIGTYRDQTMYNSLRRELGGLGCEVFQPLVNPGQNHP